jgi:hypothetical protein
MPSLLVVGDTNAGKTMIANRFVQLHPACDNPGGDAAVVPVLLVQAPLAPMKVASTMAFSKRCLPRISPENLRQKNNLRF